VDLPGARPSELLPRLEDLVRDGVDQPDGRERAADLRAPDNSSLSHFSAMTRRPGSVERRETGIATPSDRRRVDGVEDDAMIQHERAVNFDFHTAPDDRADARHEVVPALARRAHGDGHGAQVVGELRLVASQSVSPTDSIACAGVAARRSALVDGRD
jgi:hypothetical protein